MTHSVTRRSLLGWAAAIPATAALVACGSDEPASTGSAGSAAPSASQATEWTYTDDVGNTVTLKSRPERIAGFVDQVVPLMEYGLSPVALFGRRDTKTDERLTKFDLSKVTVSGISYGEIDLESLTAARPDLIVLGVYPTDAKGTIDKTAPYYGLKDMEQQTKLAKIAPIVVVTVGGKGMDVVRSEAKLAEALGAKAETISAAKTKFDTAVAALQKVLGEKKLTVTAAYADADGLYVTKPNDEPLTELYQEIGVTFTKVRDDGKWYWDQYSWENAPKAEIGDLLLVSPEGMQAAELAKQPTFNKTPALVANQVYPFSYATMDYVSQTNFVTQLTGWMSSAKKVTS